MQNKILRESNINFPKIIRPPNTFITAPSSLIYRYGIISGNDASQFLLKQSENKGYKMKNFRKLNVETEHSKFRFKTPKLEDRFHKDNYRQEIKLIPRKFSCNIYTIENIKRKDRTDSQGDEFDVLEEKKKNRFKVKTYYKIKEATETHDINTFNKTGFFIDRSMFYDRNAYKYKKLFEQDKFVNTIKEDLVKQKYDNSLKMFKGFKGY